MLNFFFNTDNDMTSGGGVNLISSRNTHTPVACFTKDNLYLHSLFKKYYIQEDGNEVIKQVTT